jgi:hypothetical protein
VLGRPGNGWIWAGAAAVAISGLLWLLLAGGEDPRGSGAGTETTGGDSLPVEPDAGIGPAGARARPREPKPAERSQEPIDRFAANQARRAYRDYIAAINDRNGDRLCKLIAPGFERALRPPAGSGSCGSRISSSIGFADERGFPVWEETILSGFESALIGEAALDVQVTATIVTRFRDREQPSIESDVAYLRPTDGSYRLLKASAALWRAVGKPDVPPEVIAPPPGF